LNFIIGKDLAPSLSLEILFNPWQTQACLPAGRGCPYV